MSTRSKLAPSNAILIGALISMMLGLAGCRGAEPTAPVDGHRELCCKAASGDNVSFVGCRTTGRCRAGESVWLRGPVTCGPVGSPDCAGGRCCQLDLEALAVRELEPNPNPSASTPNTEPSPSPGTESPAPPEPASITPIPLDWRATPTPASIPNFVCPATIERGVAGTVLLHVEVDAHGQVTQARVVEGLDPECDALARDALVHAKFEPALAPGGEPIAASLTWAYRFDDAGD